MAARQNYSAGRQQYARRSSERNSASAQMYVYGNVVTKPAYEPRRHEKSPERPVKRTSRQVRRNRRQALHGPIETTGQLTEIIRGAIPMKYQKKSGHPAKRTFQAIRIELNRELEVLRDTLDDMIELLNPGGRLCIITFHSLEDRIVKSAFKKNENPCTCPPDFPVCVCGNVSKGSIVTRKPILPSKYEMEANSRSKSAKLRIFERR